MSYDLYFTGQRIPKTEFIEYFQERRGYEVQDGQAWYENKDTGVYFSFEYEDEDVNSDDDEDEDIISYFASFNQNYYRPHFFGLEAEPELTAFVTKFGCSVYDPQREGMDGDRYSSEGFLSGWNCGNKSGYSAMLGLGLNPVENIYSRPTAELEQIWQWNYSLDDIYDDLGIDMFVPRIVFALVDGSLKTMFVWPDAIPTLIPYTDIVLIARDNLGFDRPEHICIVDRSALDAIFPDFDSSFPIPARNPDLESLPESVRDFVRGLHHFQGEISIVPHENVLNAEYVSEYLPA